jgi:hypothetical protein
MNETCSSSSVSAALRNSFQILRPPLRNYGGSCMSGSFILIEQVCGAISVEGQYAALGI